LPEIAFAIDGAFALIDRRPTKTLPWAFTSITPTQGR
jgi:hypothetical protein